MKKPITLRRSAAYFAAGAMLYALVELLWRGHTHWTMMLAGGISLCLLEQIDRRLRVPLLLRALTGAGAITVLELLFGCVINLWLGWNVWDYSARRMNLLGQICPLFSLLWYLLCLPVMAGLSRIGGRSILLIRKGEKHDKTALPT